MSQDNKDHKVRREHDEPSKDEKAAMAKEVLERFGGQQKSPISHVAIDLALQLMFWNKSLAVEGLDRLIQHQSHGEQYKSDALYSSRVKAIQAVRESLSVEVDWHVTAMICDKVAWNITNAIAALCFFYSCTTKAETKTTKAAAQSNSSSASTSQTTVPNTNTSGVVAYIAPSSLNVTGHPHTLYPSSTTASAACAMTDCKNTGQRMTCALDGYTLCVFHALETCVKSTDDQDRAKQVIQRLRARKIKCIMFDMDKTMMSKHSQGSISSSELAGFIDSLTKPTMAFISACLEANIDVAVVTFSDDLYCEGEADQLAGRSLVRPVLRKFLSESEADRVFIIDVNPELYKSHGGLLEAIKANEEKKAQAAKQEKKSRPDAWFFDQPRDVIGSRAWYLAEDNRRFYRRKMDNLLAQRRAGGAIPEKLLVDCCYYPPMLYKNHHMNVCQALTGHAFHEMMLIDDSESNIIAAKRLCRDTIHVKGEAGFQWHHMNEFMKAF